MKRLINKIDKFFKSMIPNLPTDSLYKFVFVGCIFLMGLIVYYRVSTKESLMESYDKNKIESIAINLDFAKLKLEYDKIDKLLGHQNVDRDTIDKLIDSYSEKYQSFFKADSLMRIRLDDLDRSLVKFDDQQPMYSSFIVILILIAIFSCALWYCKLQKHQDKIIKREALKP